MENKKTWHVFRNRHIPAVLPIYIYWSWSLKEKLGIDSGLIINIWDKGDYKAIWEESGFQAVSEYSFNYLSKNIKKLEKIRKEGINAGKKAISCCEKFSKRSEKADYSDYLNFLKEIEPLYNKFTEKSMLLWLFTGENVSKKIKEKMANYDEQEKKEIFETMSLPKKETYSQIEEEDFSKLIEIAKTKGLDSPITKKAIKEFSKKYFWFPFEYIGPEVWTEERILEKVKENLIQTPPSRTPENIEKKQKECISKYKLSNKLVDLFKIMQLVTIMQDDRKMANAKICYYLNFIILGNLSKKIGSTIEQTRYIDIEFVKNLIKDQNLEKARKELEEREKFLVIVQDGPKGKSFHGNEAKSELKKLEIEYEENIENIKEIKGYSANPGKTIGKVRILKTSSHIKDFREGTILVTGMTTPDFVPLMKKAGGIITDEGGITSHAAIVSRELKKPCIVGAKIATKVLKDGDLVELDANSGVIKILKKD